MRSQQKKQYNITFNFLSTNDIEDALDGEEKVLKECCDINGLPYIRPCPTLKTYVLLKTSKKYFWCRYIREVQKACQDACPLVYIA